MLIQDYNEYFKFVFLDFNDTDQGINLGYYKSVLMKDDLHYEPLVSFAPFMLTHHQEEEEFEQRMIHYRAQTYDDQCIILNFQRHLVAFNTYNQVVKESFMEPLEKNCLKVVPGICVTYYKELDSSIKYIESPFNVNEKVAH